MTSEPSHTHAHHGGQLAIDPKLGRRLNITAVVLAIATIIGLVVLWPAPSEPAEFGSLGIADDYFDATITRVENFTCPGEESSDGATEEGDSAFGGPGVCQNVVFELTDGPDAGEERSVELFDVGPYPQIAVGDKVVVPYLEDALPAFQYSQSFEREREWPMIVLAGMFALLVVIQGRLRGLAALAGLAASFGVILLFVLPALVQGRAPVPVAMVAASLVAFLALYLAHGVNPLTTVALLGTLASLLVVGGLSWWFTRLTVLSGIDEDAQFIRAFGGDLDFRGLLLAGMIIGALGALDDMTVTQSSVVAELRAANPDMGFSELFRAASRVGRDHISSTVNTLALAYAGAALPLLLVFVGSQVPLSRVLASEVVATEIVRTLVGSIGLVASVPLTTALAARIVSGRGRGTERAPEERPTTPDGSAPSAAVPVSGDAGDPDPESGGGQGGPPEDDPDPDWSGYLEQHEP